MRPKILKIMLIDAYNASIIHKCLCMPIILWSIAGEVCGWLWL